MAKLSLAHSETVPASERLAVLPTDAAIVAALLARQRAGGAALYDRYHRHVSRVLTRVLGPDAALDDLLHDVFVAAIEGIERLAEPEALRGWLTSIAVFQARAEIRRRRRTRWLVFFAHDEVPEVAGRPACPEASEALRAAYRALDELPVDDRMVLALRLIDGMDLLEVATVCRVSLATAKRRLARARKRFAAIARRSPALAPWLNEERWT